MNNEKKKTKQKEEKQSGATPGTWTQFLKALIVCMTMKKLRLKCSLHLVELEDDHNVRTMFTVTQFQIGGEGTECAVRWCAVDRDWKEPDRRQRCE